MGLVEGLLEQLSFKAVAIILTGAYVAFFLVKRIDEHRRIKALGNYGIIYPSYLPLSLDFVLTNVKSTLKHANLTLWRDEFFLSRNTWTIEARVLGMRAAFTADPANVKAILATQFTDYGKGEPFHADWQEFLGDSIFTTDGQQWHTSRQLIRPQFTRDRISDLYCFESHMQTLFRVIANGGALQGEHQKVDMGAVNGRVIDISEILFRYTLDVATEFLLGSDVKSMSTVKQPFAEAFNEVQHIQNIHARIFWLRHLLPSGRFKRGLATINHFVNHYIDLALKMTPAELAARSKDDHNYTFLHALAAFTRDRKVLRDQIVAILLAGRDTTATTLSWTLYELSRNPAAVKKLRAEILETVGGPESTPSYEHLKNMTYLKAVMNETLRLYPAVPFNVRLALHDTTLPRGGGPDGSEPLPILKDQPVAYSTLVMQRRPDLYPPVSDTFADPAVYSPERWLHWHPRPHDYVPFNAGPRICIGQQFALTEMGYVLTRLFQRYDTITSHMDAVDGGDPLLKADIVLTPGQGVKVAFTEAKY